MSLFRFRIARSGIILSVVLTANAAVADTTKLIFSAENALYGAGYQIGRADGWMDDSLREAIRLYQKRNPQLSVSGNLDSDTLTALGIASQPGLRITANDVATKAEALAVLGMSEAKKAPPAPKASPEPKKLLAETFEVPPAPLPEPASTPPAKPVAPVTPEPAAAINNTPAKVAQAPEETARNPIDNSPAPVNEVSSEIQAEQPVLTAAAPVKQPPAPEPTQTQPEREEPKIPAISETATISEDVPIQDEPPEPAVTGAPETNEESSSRSFFGTVFDFLFGWMV